MAPKTIVLTGASSGIGAALTPVLAAEGHRLFVCARREDKLREVTDNGRLARYLRVNVGEEEDVRAFARMVADDVGYTDALICCAGAYGVIGPAHQVAPDSWWAALRANLFGTFLSVHHFVPLLMGRPGARVIGFSGGGAFNPLPRYSAYAASKAGIVRLLETLAVELAPMGITVNGIAPGFVKTEIHDATLSAGPERAGDDFHAMTVAKLNEGYVPMNVPVACVQWLLSDAAHGLTGKTISASFDPWSDPRFQAAIHELNDSDLYTMRRINLRNLPGDIVVEKLTGDETSKN